MEAIQSADPALVSRHDVKLGQIIAAYHDIVQNWEPETKADGRVVRKRAVVKNEEDSFLALKERMDEHNKKSGEIFSARDLETAREAMMATVPGWDMKSSTVIQPNLAEQPSLVALAVALADIGAAGFDTQAYLKDGDAIFREENLDILDDLQNLGQVSEAKKEDYVGRMINWNKVQVVFAKGRKSLLEKELASLPSDETKEKVRVLFSHFDESIAVAQERANDREARVLSGELNFESLAKEMGY
ncbi:MAG: hypothetical protein ACD_72C00048G0001 [uncultured bacterium]|nr:MAG: hypothetical protein ACD_72C00048G0001 [uncultured bacterium]